jgi:hypothetical protein
MKNALDAAIVFAISIILLCAAAWAQPQYTATDLGVLDPNFWPMGFNDHGVVVGQIHRSDASYPAMLVNGQLLSLEIPGWASRINNKGEAVGLGETPTSYHGFIWDANGWRFWPVPQGTIRSIATGINESGQASLMIDVGTVDMSLWRAARAQGESVTLLPSLSGGFDWAQAINNHGDVAMESEATNAEWHAVVVDMHGSLFDLGSFDLWEITAINDKRQLTGTVQPENGPYQAFRGQPGSGIERLAIPEGYSSSWGSDIDNDGTVVGIAHRAVNPPTPSTLPIRWAPDGEAVDLNTLIDPASGWVLRRAIGIRQGKIMGTGTLHGQGRIFLLTPAPQSPALTLRLNQPTFAAGETLRMALHLRNPGPLLTTDAFVGVIMPDGQTVLWLTDTAPLEGVVNRLDSNPSAFVPMLRNVSWPAGLDATQADYLTYTFHGLDTPGTYHLLVAWTKPGSLADGAIDEGDVIALDWQVLQFVPQVASR